jgi:hypothetical protein
MCLISRVLMRACPPMLRRTTDLDLCCCYDIVPSCATVILRVHQPDVQTIVSWPLRAEVCVGLLLILRAYRLKSSSGRRTFSTMHHTAPFRPERGRRHEVRTNCDSANRAGSVPATDQRDGTADSSSDRTTTRFFMLRLISPPFTKGGLRLPRTYTLLARRPVRPLAHEHLSARRPFVSIG